LRGSKAIAEFTGETERRFFYAAERGLLPIGKMGSTLFASKRKLREHYAAAGGQVASIKRGASA
jgi:hypothetical protein